jgi:hypothetical protein
MKHLEYLYGEGFLLHSARSENIVHIDRDTSAYPRPQAEEEEEGKSPFGRNTIFFGNVISTNCKQ